MSKLWVQKPCCPSLLENPTHITNIKSIVNPKLIQNKTSLTFGKIKNLMFEITKPGVLPLKSYQFLYPNTNTQIPKHQYTYPIGSIKAFIHSLFLSFQLFHGGKKLQLLATSGLGLISTMRLDGRKVIEFAHSAWSIFHSKLKAGITDEDVHTYKQTHKPDQTSRQVSFSPKFIKEILAQTSLCTSPPSLGFKHLNIKLLIMLNI